MHIGGVAGHTTHLLSNTGIRTISCFCSPHYTLTTKDFHYWDSGERLDGNFYMGTQNGQLWSRDFFDSHLRIKVTPPRVLNSPYVYIGKPCICNVSTCGVRYLQTCSQLHVVWVASTVYLGVLCVGLWTIFFCLVCRLPWKTYLQLGWNFSLFPLLPPLLSHCHQVLLHNS